MGWPISFIIWAISWNHGSFAFSGAVWSGVIVFASTIKFNRNCTWIHVAEVNSGQYFRTKLEKCQCDIDAPARPLNERKKNCTGWDVHTGCEVKGNAIPLPLKMAGWKDQGYDESKLRSFYIWSEMSLGIRFPTMWYVWTAKAQIWLLIGIPYIIWSF